MRQFLVEVVVVEEVYFFNLKILFLNIFFKEGIFHTNKSRERSQERRGRDFETSIRKCVNIHSDVKQAILLYG